jgi:hypothetical protein
MNPPDQPTPYAGTPEWPKPFAGTPTPDLAPTPRTDAARNRYDDLSGNPCNSFDFVEPEDMATLERELTRLRAQLAAIEEDGTQEHNAAVSLRLKLVTALDRAEKAEARVAFLETAYDGASASQRMALARAEKAEAEVERWKTVAAQMTAEREHNANEAGRLRAEVERLKGALALGQQNCDDAYDDLREERDSLRAEVERLKGMAIWANIARAAKRRLTQRGWIGYGTTPTTFTRTTGACWFG